MKLVYLEWRDAVSNARWFESDEAQKWGAETDWLVREAGWLVEETKEYIVISTSWKPADDWMEEKFCNLHKIPKSWVKKYLILKEVR